MSFRNLYIRNDIFFCIYLSCLFFAHNSIENKADNKHCSSYDNPAEAKVVKWQRTADCADKAKGDADAVYSVNYADNRCAEDCERIDKAVAADKFIAQTENNQHNGNRIDCVEYRYRDAEDCCKTLITYRKGENCYTDNKFVVADGFEKC